MLATTIAIERAVLSGNLTAAAGAHLKEIFAAHEKDLKFDPSQEYYTTQQVAKKIGVHVQTVREYIRDGIIKAKLYNNTYRIHRQELARYEKSLKP